MAKRATKMEVRVKKMVGKIIEEAERSSDPTDRLKAVKVFVAYQTMLLKSQKTQKKAGYGSGWDNLRKSSQNLSPVLKKLADDLRFPLPKD